MQPHGILDPEPTGPLFEWGSVGTNTVTSHAGRRIVQREVEPDVDYQEPPVDVVPSWGRFSGDPRRFDFIPEQGADPQTFQTFHRLGRDLRDHPPVSSQDPRLDRLEAAASALVQLVQKLHENGWGIGLLHPHNVLVTPGPAPAVLPVDLGFVCDGLLAPRWLTSPFAPLWDLEPPEQQHAAPAATFGEPSDTIDPRPAVKALARFLDMVLTGRIEKIVTAPPLPAPPGSAPGALVRRASTAWDKLWALLAATSANGQESAAELGQLLAAAQLRNHYFPPRVTPRKSPLLAVVLALLIVGGGITGAVWFGGLGGQHEVPTGGTRGPTALAEQIKELEKELPTAPPVRQTEIVVEAYKRAADSKSGQAAAESLRHQALVALAERGRKAIANLNQEQSLDNYKALMDVRRDLANHLSRMTPLTASDSLAKEEQQCLAYVRTFSVELGWEP